MATVCADSEFHYPVVIGGGGWERRWTRRRGERQRRRGEEAAEAGRNARMVCQKDQTTKEKVQTGWEWGDSEQRG